MTINKTEVAALATWKELSLDCLNAAKMLRDSNYLRSSVSRSYYAAYSAVTDKLPRGMAFPHGWGNPSHEQILRLIKNLPKLSKNVRQRTIRDFRILLHARQTADYRPTHHLGSDFVLECIHHALSICKTMEVL